MEIAHARIDDRLIHGQVVTAWLQAIGKCHEILICDDRACKDPFLQSVLKMTAPPNIGLRVLSVNEAALDFKAKVGDNRRVFLLTRGPEPILKLIEGGVPMTYLNLGGMGAGPGRTILHQNISVSEDEMQTLRQIQSKGVKIELKMVPTDRGVDFAGLSNRKGR